MRPTVYYQGGRESGPRYSKALCYNFVVRPMRIKYTSDENLTVHGMYTVFQKNPCDYVFDDNLNSKRPIVIIFGTVIT